MAEDSLLRTPLSDIHVEWSARMVEFAGWWMPVQFAGVIEEHNHTRTACSVFDVSHMGRLRLAGKGCESFLNRICTRKLITEPGRSFYSHVCREDGGILDDVIVSCFDKDRWGVVCNASNRDKIVAWLTKHMTDYDVSLADETLSTAMVAVQGPQTLDIASSLASSDLGSLRRYRLVQHNLMGMSITIYRGGYTGEDGFEVVIPAGLAPMLMPRLLGTPSAPHPVVKPAGLGARDTLRLEAAMPLYGHEMHEDVDPLTAGQGWCVDLTKDFIGCEPLRKLKEEGLPRRLVGLELEGRRIARQHHAVFADGGKVGEVTSGTLSPTLGKSIAMALVASEYTKESTQLEVELGRKRVAARVVPLPFYKKR